MQKIKKAVFPVAGFGTRFLPATKAMLKEAVSASFVIKDVSPLQMS